MESLREGRKEIKVLSLINRGRNSKEEDMIICPWLNLPIDLWYGIMEYLSLTDQIRLLLVSKSFSKLLSLQHNNPINRLPWLLQFKISKTDCSFTCKLFDPIHEYPYEIYRIENICPDYMVSKHGWLFFLTEICNYSKSEYSRLIVVEVLLFCPYTKEIIRLPALSCNLQGNKRLRICSNFDELLDISFASYLVIKPLATFSTSNPNSEQCVFFVVYYQQGKGKFIVYSCQRKDEEWKTCEFNLPQREGAYLDNEDVVYHEGKLYIIFGHLIVIYDHDNGDNYVINYDPMSDDDESFAYSFFNLFVLEGSLHYFTTKAVLKKLGIHGEELFAINASCKYGMLRRGIYLGDELVEFDYRTCRLFKCKFKQDDDFEEKILGNRALFLGSEWWDSSFLVENLSGDEFGILSNKVIYHENCMKLFDMSECKVKIQKKYFAAGKGGLRRVAWVEPPNHVNELLSRFSSPY